MYVYASKTKTKESKGKTAQKKSVSPYESMGRSSNTSAQTEKLTHYQSLGISRAVSEPNQTGIPTQTKSKFENLSGFSFDDVRTHYNLDKSAQLQALAYTHENQEGHEFGNNEPLQMKAKDKVVQFFKVEGNFTAITTGKNGTNQRACSEIFDIEGGTVVSGENKEIVNAASQALTDLTFPDNKCLGAHMLPKKLGGKGEPGFNNVKPWLESFEINTWNKVMEVNLNDKIKEIKKDDKLVYTVETDDMTDDEAQNVVENFKSKNPELEKSDEIKKGIKPIPKSVKGSWAITGSVSGSGEVDSSACTPITEYKNLKQEAKLVASIDDKHETGGA